MKININMARASFALFGLAALGGCAATRAAERHDAVACRPDAAAALVGQIAPDDAVILRRTGSATVRRIAPGDMTTQDFRTGRVTVTIAGDRVVAASCG